MVKIITTFSYEGVVYCSVKYSFTIEKSYLTDVSANVNHCSHAGKGQNVTVENIHVFSKDYKSIIGDVSYECVDNQGRKTGLLGQKKRRTRLALLNDKPIIAKIQSSVSNLIKKQTFLEPSKIATSQVSLQNI